MRYIENPPNPWLSTTVEWIGEPPESPIEVFEEYETRSIITHNDSPDVGFDYSVNCYRGCPHACTYCFSRPTHEYLGYGAGTDFETKIVAKVRAPELLRAEFMKKSWRGESLMFSFTSDPYIPLEAHYKLTRQCLEVCVEFQNPVGLLTKSALVRRDIDVLSELASKAEASVTFTIPFDDYETARALEPFAPSPDARFRAMRQLADAGIKVGIGIAPVVPGLNDPHIPALLKKAKDAGASHAFMNILRLPGSVAPYFVQRLKERLPTKAERVLSRIRETRDGRLNNSEFGERMHGNGEYWRMVERSFHLHRKRLGIGYEEKTGRAEPKAKTFRRPSAQGSLF
jgi:DNA repair photolyase